VHRPKGDGLTES
jgi:hypothetical protein